MALNEPESMDDLVYFSRRASGKGRITAWVYRKTCPKCGDKMGKPVDSKTGKVKSRSDIYICQKCGYSEPKKEHEESLTLEAKYTCSACGKEGEGTTLYKRKTFEGVPAYVIECMHCGKKIGITKKMKESKKGKKAEDEDI